MVFTTLISLKVFQNSFLLFITFDIVLGRHICWTRSCEFVVYKYSFFTYVEFHRGIRTSHNWQQSRTPITPTNSNFPSMSSHFSVIFTQLTRTRINRIPRFLELTFLSSDSEFTEINPDNSNSGCCNSTRMPTH